MRRIIETTKVIIKDNLSSPFVIFWVILFPAILLGIFYAVFGGISTLYKVNVYVIGDYNFTAFLNTSGIFNGINGGNVNLVERGSGILVDFNNLSIYYPPQYSSFIPSLKALISEYLHHDLNNFSEFSLGNYTYVSYLSTGVIGILIFSNGILGISGVVSSYYREKIVERLASTVLENYEWSISVILYEVIITFLSTIVIILMGLALGFRPNINFISILVILLGSIIASALGAIIYGISPKEKPFVSQTIAITIVFPLMLLSNSFLPEYSYPSIIRTFVEYQPISLLNSLLRETLLFGYSLDSVSLIALILFTALGIIISIFTLRLRET